MASPLSTGESPSPTQFGAVLSTSPLLGGHSAPKGTPLLPAVNQKVAAEGWSRGGRLRHHKINPNAFQEGEASLLFVEDGTGGKRDAVMKHLEDPLGDAKRRVGVKNPVERRAREAATGYKTPLAAGHAGGLSQQQSQMVTESARGGTAIPLTDSSSQCTEASRAGVQQRSRRVAKNALEYDPKTYTELLPATLKMRKVGDMQVGIVPSAAVNEMLAERDVQHANRGALAMHGKRLHAVSLVELQDFLGEMNQLQERGRYMRRRWRRHLPCVAALNGGAIRMVDEDDDTSSEGLEEADSDGDLQLTSLKRQQQRGEATRAAISTWQEEINALQFHGGGARGAALLRDELKKSRRNVEKARQGVALSKFLMIENVPQGNTPEEGGQRGSLGDPRRLSAEDISWRTENAASQRTASPLSLVCGVAGGLERANDGNIHHGGDQNNTDNDPIDHHSSTRLLSLLHRGKGTAVYGLDATRRHRNNKAQQHHSLVASQLSLPSASGMTSPIDLSAPWARAPRDNSELKASHAQYGTQRLWRPLPIEYGVGEQSSLRLKAQVTQWHLENCQMEVQNEEDIRRTRELLHELLPRRVTLLEESLKNSRDNARVILQQHRRHIFERVAQKDFEGRKQACLAYVDLLEQTYGSAVPESCVAAVRKALQKARSLITISPERCNARSYQSILKEHFLISHLVELPIRDLLWRLAELFGMTRAQYKSAMSHAYQLLNTPRDYQARFREIDRTLVGVSPPTERRVRLTLHRCRFVQMHNTVGTAHAFSATGGGRGRELSEVSVQIKTENQVFLSTAVRARASGDEESFSWNVSRRDDKHPPLCGANFMDQIFRFHFCESAELAVALLHNGLVMASGKFCLSDCNFNLRGVAMLWFRLSGNGGVEAEIKLTLAMLGEKNQPKKTLRK